MNNGSPSSKLSGALEVSEVQIDGFTFKVRTDGRIRVSCEDFGEVDSFRDSALSNSNLEEVARDWLFCKRDIDNQGGIFMIREAWKELFKWLEGNWREGTCDAIRNWLLYYTDPFPPGLDILFRANRPKKRVEILEEDGCLSMLIHEWEKCPPAFDQQEDIPCPKHARRKAGGIHVCDLSRERL